MNYAKYGNTIKVHYTGSLADGFVFDSSREREPIEFQIGSGSLIPGFEDGVIGMAIGEIRTVIISDTEGYGHRSEDLVIKVKKENIPENITPEVGQQFQITQPDGHSFNATITDLDDETVTLDANHPLAGKTLSFEIELVDIL